MDLMQRRIWNENHKKLTEIILKPEEHASTIQLFLAQHASLHSSTIANKSDLTLEDELMTDLDDTTFRNYPVNNPDTKNSIAWHLWHIARIEDVTMNILVSDVQQVQFDESWLDRMNIECSHTGNNMTEDGLAKLSSNIDFDSLLAYRAAVGVKTRQVVSLLEPGQFKMKVEPARIKRLLDENAVAPNASWLADYWSKKTIAGLILMPATRHNYLHLNKCIRIKERLLKQKKER